MLLNCPSCKAQYLVNSADLLSDGRDVRCIKCNSQWFQKPKLEHTEDNEKKSHNIKKDNYENNYSKTLPSTYVEEQKVSFRNSFLMIIFLLLIAFSFYIISNLDKGIINLLIFYFDNAIINTNLFIDNFSKIIFDILN